MDPRVISRNVGGKSMAETIVEMPIIELVDRTVEVDTDGEVIVGDHLVIIQMEIVDRIKGSQKE